MVLTPRTKILPGHRYIVPRDGLLVELPRFPDHGAWVEFLGVTGVTSFCVSQSGSRIMGLDEPLNADIPGFFFRLTYHDKLSGWRLPDV